MTRPVLISVGGQLFHYFGQGNHPCIIANGERVITAIDNEFMCCSDILTGFAIVLAKLGCDTMLDFHGPDIPIRHFYHQIDFRTRSGAEKAGLCQSRRGLCS